VIGKTVFITPGGIAASTLMIVTLFRAHNATVTLGQLGETGIAVALIKALFAATTTVNAVDLPQILQSDRLAQQVIERQ
jgi:hypothetical protein